MSTAPPNGRTWSFTLAIAGTVVHAALAIAVLVLYLTYVPAAMKTFDEFGLILSSGTRLVCRFSNWVAEYWWLAVFVSPVIAAIDFVVTAVLSARSRFAALLWIALVALVFVAVFALTVVAIQIPLADLNKGLAR